MNLDRFNRADRECLETRRAAQVTRPVRIRTRERHTVEGHPDVLRIHSAETWPAGLGFDVVNIDTGEILQELADVSICDIAEDVGCDRCSDVHVATLIHDRLGIALAF